MIESLIEERYQLTSLISRNERHEVFKGIDIVTQEKISLKREISGFNSKIVQEVQILQSMQGERGFPVLISHGRYKSRNYHITNLLGKSLKTRLHEQKKFSLPCVLKIADELLQRIQTIHSRGFIHQSFSASNFVSGYSCNWHQIYLIDFSQTTPIQSRDSNSKSNFDNTINLYSSINALHKMILSRRDDLESLAYLLIHLLKGELPWSKLKRENQNEIEKFRSNIKIEEICKECPHEFLVFLRYCRNLSYEEVPDYEMLKNLFKNYAKREYIIRVYDWKVSNEKILKTVKHCRKNFGSELSGQAIEENQDGINRLSTTCFMSQDTEFQGIKNSNEEQNEINQFLAAGERISSLKVNFEIKCLYSLPTIRDRTCLPQFKDRKKILE